MGEPAARTRYDRNYAMGLVNPCVIIELYSVGQQCCVRQVSQRAGESPASILFWYIVAAKCDPVPNALKRQFL